MLCECQWEKLSGLDLFVLLLGLSYLLRDALCDIMQVKCLTQFLVHNNDDDDSTSFIYSFV